MFGCGMTCILFSKTLFILLTLLCILFSCLQSKTDDIFECVSVSAKLETDVCTVESVTCTVAMCRHPCRCPVETFLQPEVKISSTGNIELEEETAKTGINHKWNNN